MHGGRKGADQGARGARECGGAPSAGRRRTPAFARIYVGTSGK